MNQTFEVLKEVTLPVEVSDACPEGTLAYDVGATVDLQEDKFTGSDELLNELVTNGTLNPIVDGGEYDGEMGYYKVTGDIEYTDENGENPGKIDVGSIQYVPTVIGEKWIKEGAAELSDETAYTSFTESLAKKDDGETVVSGGSLAADEIVDAPITDTVEQAETPKFYMGKAIISRYPRIVEGKSYHHIRLEDGSEHDLTDEAYKVVMKA